MREMIATHGLATTRAVAGDSWRALGEVLDAWHNETALQPRLLAAVDGGIVGTVEDGADDADTAVAWSDEELTALAAPAPAHRSHPQPPLRPSALAPTGYSDLLRALALWAREGNWSNLRLLFLRDCLWISYGRPGACRERVLDHEAVCMMLDDVYHRRQDPRAPTRMPVIEPPTVRPAGPWTVMRAQPYARDLARVGRALDRDRAADPLMAETTEGLMVVTLRADGRQRAHVVDPAACPPRPWWSRSMGSCEEVLGALGARLDAIGGHHALAAARPDGDWLVCSTVRGDRRVVSGNPLVDARTGRTPVSGVS